MAEDQLNSRVSAERLYRLRKLKAEKFSRYFLLLALIGIMVVFFNMVKIFLVPVMLAAVFTALFYPFFKRLLKIFRNNRGLSSLVCCLVLLLGLLVPTYVVIDLVSREAIDFSDTAEHKVRDIIEKGDQGPLGKIKEFGWFQQISWSEVDWQSSVQSGAKTMANILTTVINKTSRGTIQLVTSLFITLFTMFYFFRDGDQLVQRLKYLSPLDEIYEEALIFRFVSVSKATIRGTLLIGLMQGILGGFTLWIFGVSSAVLWGVVMVILSIIPLVGAWLVLYPAGIIQIITGNIWQGLAIILISVFVIGNIDNILRPRLVGRDAGMHDLMIFFSTLGGISVFGIMGFIIGPVGAVLFLTVLDIYSIEFQSHLELAEGVVKGKSSSRRLDRSRDPLRESAVSASEEQK